MSDVMSFDVIIVGAGPAGLSCAIRYAQLCRKANKEPSICIIEKGAEVGAHILSGAAFEPRALNELLPDWESLGAPLEVKVTSDHFLYLNAKKAIRLPTPPQMKNPAGNYIISLGKLCRWLSVQAVSLGVEIYPGFAASEAIIEDNQVKGILIGDMGLDKHNQRKHTYQPGVKILAKQTILAEGCRGSLSQQLIRHYNLKTQPQTYGIGIKEIWEIPAKKHESGKVVHTFGWPLDSRTYGGGFIYHFENNLLSLGLIVGLDYQNPYLDPYEEFQRFKQHDYVKSLLKDGQCISYGSRAINEGGWQSIPKLTFPGGMLIGCSAGFLNVPKIKGSHNAMKSGMLAAETIFEKMDNDQIKSASFEERIKKSWMGKELYAARNIRPAFRMGLWGGLLYSAIDTYVFRGHAPWTFSNHADHTTLKKANQCEPIAYAKPDGIISFDRMTSLTRAHVFHEENQPVHLKLTDPKIAVAINWKEYLGPEQRYCPAGVYEFLDTQEGKKLQINAQNCIHCKTCDIKDPMQNITWLPPEGGGGPNYSNM